MSHASLELHTRVLLGSGCGLLDFAAQLPLPAATKRSFGWESFQTRLAYAVKGRSQSDSQRQVSEPKGAQ